MAVVNPRTVDCLFDSFLHPNANIAEIKKELEILIKHIGLQNLIERSKYDLRYAISKENHHAFEIIYYYSDSDERMISLANFFKVKNFNSDIFEILYKDIVGFYIIHEICVFMRESKNDCGDLKKLMTMLHPYPEMCEKIFEIFFYRIDKSSDSIINIYTFLLTIYKEDLAKLFIAEERGLDDKILLCIYKIMLEITSLNKCVIFIRAPGRPRYYSVQFFDYKNLDSRYYKIMEEINIEIAKYFIESYTRQMACYNLDILFNDIQIRNEFEVTIGKLGFVLRSDGDRFQLDVAN